ncbi:PREDICTED: 4-hydroxybutyrate coenzyme A transferase [Nicrophorus vespilloides]|uniref:4-hydroxybutyrate coenzyme A transferase n=1 Tax=Nicrophorus vespilloides TaxID=110193 RepID=A0ABM1MS78_NICVS|nr:PREDICTED: 4-hydroxybutyrate coenzyme A transferase [Nicrophorus vespilloides]
MASAAVNNVSKFGSFLSHIKKISPRTYYTYVNEPAQPIPGKEPKFVTPDQAFEKLQSGNTVYIQGAAATPLVLIEAMTKFGKENKLKDVMVCHMHTEGPALYCDPSCEGIFRSNSFFMGGNVRKAVSEGRGDAIPIFLHEIPLLFYRKIVRPDIALIQVSPPDSHGFCSLGTSVDVVRSALQNSKYIVAQINQQMPRTFGDGIIHISHIDYAIKTDIPLPVHGGRPLSAVETQIGKHIAENLIEDGATLQMGIGNIPDAVLSQLTNHKDLGIHSEMFADGVVELAEKGCITNSMKTKHKGRIVGSFLIGTKKLYDFVDNNPFIEMLTIDYVNNTRVISEQPKMTAINSAIEVDITGQVVSDSIGTRMYSGFGGQVDFIRGAAEGLDGKGKPIIALPSVTNKGESKIAITPKLGAGVVTSRAHVHYVVTEHGIANLFGKSLRQRAHALIQIAHPDHRANLEKAAFERFKCMPSA